MGIFTWTDAQYKKPRMNKWGDYPRKYVVEYGEYARLVCPDNTILETDCHNYYGTINGYDIYDLVAEWNREDIPRLYKAIKEKGKSSLYKNFDEIVKMFHKGIDDNIISNKIKEMGFADFLIHDWKRTIGIDIACWDDMTDMLKYPIKLTKNKNINRYDQLYRSYSTQ